MSELEPFGDDDASLDEDARRLLRAGRDLGVPRGAKGAVWAALATGLPSVAAASTATTSVLTAASLVKYGAIGVLLGAGTMTTVTLVRAPSGPPRAASARSAAPAPPPAPLPVERPRVSEPPADVAAPVTSALPGPSLPRSAVSAPVAPPAGPELAPPDAESRRVAAARALTRAGRPREALAALDGIARDLPNGELVQEREALAIEALLTLGEAEAARKRATAFLKRFPSSPHAATARRALE